MKLCTRRAVAVLVGALAALVVSGASAADKNWAAPAYRMYGQALSDQTMAAHPELLSVTLHGVPPGLKDIYTMFAGSFPERIGNPDDPDDIDVIKLGITILDPRWQRTRDTDKKFVVLMPMRDIVGENIGLVVYAFKAPAGNLSTSAAEIDYLRKASTLRDALQRKIPSYKALFDPVK